MRREPGVAVGHGGWVGQEAERAGGRLRQAVGGPDLVPYDLDVAGVDVRLGTAATAADLAGKAGVYRDPWFGEVSLCAQDNGVAFAAAKSPKMSGKVMRSGKRLLVQWHGPDAEIEPWLEFPAVSGNASVAMRMAKVDPDGDFSSDYEDLAFERIRDCP